MTNWLKQNWLNLILIIALIAGVVLIVYPTVSNSIYSFRETNAIMSYTESISEMEQEDYDRVLEGARKYNAELAKTGIKRDFETEDRARYLRQLIVDSSGIIGYINIPKVNIKLPIYLEGDRSNSQAAIEHMRGTSLPIGGKGSNCVITGQSGLPSAKLFTDIEKLEAGDHWTITCLNESVTYAVDEIITAKNLSEIKIEKDKDICTLVTDSSDEMILVKGHRVPNSDGDAPVSAEGVSLDFIYMVPVFWIPAAALFLMAIIIAILKAKRRDSREDMMSYLEEHDIYLNI